MFVGETFPCLGSLRWFHLIEGDQSPRVAVIIQMLLSPELRPSLRLWYQDCGDRMNPAAVALREHLS
jgi:hypothetical protein